MSSKEITRKANRLAGESSPYLLQHAYNPVEWYPWGDEPFKKAKRENKLVLLSIGYSACHWCHVMAHESFENDSIATIMNDNYVCIKVDREEYPEVDHLYQTYVQLTTGSGGWPLTVFLTANRIPIFGGTYFPDAPRYGKISFPQLLERMKAVYTTQSEKMSAIENQTKKIFQNMNPPGKEEILPNCKLACDTLFQKLQQSFDNHFGGFYEAPKFPHTSDLAFLLSYYFFTGEKNARHMVLFSLKKMAEGGIYDQLGGGFHRYSTDKQWLVPHFEKMLYDNALLIPIYVNAFRLSGDPFYKKIALETSDFVLREFRDPRGAFYSALDADSNGGEGRFYVWDYLEIKKHLDPEMFSVFCEFYHITPRGNFEGKNILNITGSMNSISQKYNLSPAAIEIGLEKAASKLKRIRRKRIRPALDNKILTDWNGMMISALWKVFQISGKEKYRQSAEQATFFLCKNYLNKDGSLIHYLKKDSRKIRGYLDDYAYFIQALLDGFETIQKPEYFLLAIKLTDYVLKNFSDLEKGGFFTTDKFGDTIITRLRQEYDSSFPAGNNIMQMNLLRLYYYTGDNAYLKLAEQHFKLYKNEIESYGQAFASMLHTLLYYFWGPVELVISSPDDSGSYQLGKILNRLFIPERVVVDTGSGRSIQKINPGLLADRTLPDKVALFICYRGECSLPIENVNKIPQALEKFNLYLS
jgi:uncharacterized protein YyaL (SSP411 family)